VIRIAGAFLVLATAAAAAIGVAQAQERTSAHMEGCLVWNRPEGPVMVGNECSRPISLKFMDLETQKSQTVELAPGQRLTTDTEWGHPAGFMFTACPVGFRPSVGFSVENKEPISASLYNCVVGEPTS
jgi:hypothetical protein